MEKSIKKKNIKIFETNPGECTLLQNKLESIDTRHDTFQTRTFFSQQKLHISRFPIALVFIFL